MVPPARGRRIAMVALSVLLVLCPESFASDLPEASRSFTVNLTNLENAVKRLARDYASPVALLRTHKTEARYIEAKILYELENYQSASVLFMDLMDDDKFRKSVDYYRGALMLGESLLKGDNERGAKRYLRRVIEGPDEVLADKAGFLLVEMALNEEDDDALRKLATRIPRGRTGQTSYALGKGWIRLGDPQRALDLLGHVPAGDPLFVRARYYQAVAFTALKMFDKGKEVFGELSQITEPDVTLQKVRDLAVLGLGRLMLEDGDLLGAINEYQRISRFSPSYEVALYEMAWAYIKGEQYDKGLSTIDSLLLTVKDPALDVEAHTLRGRLNIYLNDYESASETFDTIVSRFAPIRNELEKFTRDPDNIQRYFEWLLERESPTAKLRAPLTKRTADWVESSDDMVRIAAVFRDLSTQKQEVHTTQEIAKLLEKIVQSRNRVELFPGLKDGWARTLVLENQLLTLSTRILDHQSALARKWLEPDEQGRLTSMLSWRRELERRFAKLPRTFAQYEEREERVAERFLDLKRQSFVIGQRMRDIERQILALENYVNERQYREGGDRFSDEKEDEFRAALEDEKRRLVALQREVGRLDARLDVESHSVGAGDAAGEGDANLKRAVIEAHKREGLFYDRTAVRSGKATGGHFRVLGDRRERIWQGMSRLLEIVAAIDLKVGEKVAELHAEIKKEKQQIRRYERELSRYRTQGRQISQQIGSSLFQKAREQMKQVVLKADVGLIDVAWQMKREKTDAIRKVNRERSGKLSRLRRNLDELTRDRIAAPTPPAPPTPPASSEAPAEGAPAEGGPAKSAPSGEGGPAEGAPTPETSQEPDGDDS